ncbi:MAG: LapA family protein [Aquincola sp.]|nr:LapA family protein [Aquincola sp.]MDH4290728.1 LapA family protein [Aquincola sp.]
MRLLSWTLRALVFFALFAFALNNQQEVTVHWFFGMQWQSPMIIVVLAAFALGCAIGVLAMVPSWWRERRVARQVKPVETAPTASSASSAVPSQFGAEAAMPPRENL